MNYLALVRRLKQESGVTGPLPSTVASATGDTARLANWINDEWLQIQNLDIQYNWKWMRASLDGSISDSKGFAYTADTLLDQPEGTVAFRRWRQSALEYDPRVTSLTTGASWSLTYLNLDAWNNLYLPSVTPGPPQSWSISDQGELLIGPYPDTTYAIRVEYKSGPVTLVNDSDAPGFPEFFHTMIVWGALYDYASYDSAPEIVARAERRYSAALSALIQNQGETPRLAHKTLEYPGSGWTDYSVWA